METKLRFYKAAASQSKKRCRVLPSGNPEKVKDDMIQIKFSLHKFTILPEVAGEGKYPSKICCPLRVPTFVADKLVPMVSREKLLKHREAYAKRYGTAVLSALFGVPESEQGSITDTMFEVVETAIPLRRISVSIVEVSQQVHRVKSETSPAVVAAVEEGLKDVAMADLPQDEVGGADTTAAASTSTSSDRGVSEVTELVDSNVVSKKKSSAAGDKVERPRRSTKVPGYLKGFVQNKGKYSILYC